MPAAGLRAIADAAIASWEIGDGLGDGFLHVRRTPDGFAVYDGEAPDPAPRPATREEARMFVVAIASAA